jgi:hypothetical protein
MVVRDDSFSKRMGLVMQYILRTADGTSWFVDSIDHKWQHIIPQEDTGPVIEEGQMLCCTTPKLGKPVTFFLPYPGTLTGQVGKLIESAKITSIEFDGNEGNMLPEAEEML